jgi:hypothetical protein
MIAAFTQRFILTFIAPDTVRTRGQFSSGARGGRHSLNSSRDPRLRIKGEALLPGCPKQQTVTSPSSQYPERLYH